MTVWQTTVNGTGFDFSHKPLNHINIYRAMQKGNIRVQTENIFPIIKKFLYSDHDIFIRELVSNAVDATQKLRTLSSLGEAKGDLGDLTIDIILHHNGCHKLQKEIISLNLFRNSLPS